MIKVNAKYMKTALWSAMPLVLLSKYGIHIKPNKLRCKCPGEGKGFPPRVTRMRHKRTAAAKSRRRLKLDYRYQVKCPFCGRAGRWAGKYETAVIYWKCEYKRMGEFDMTVKVTCKKEIGDIKPGDQCFLIGLEGAIEVISIKNCYSSIINHKDIPEFFDVEVAE